MTPLAMKVANELTLPKAKRTFDDRAHVLDLFDQEMHCFEVSAIAKSVTEVMDGPRLDNDAEECWEIWNEIGTMLPQMFLPSPVTWLEQVFNGCRLACVIWEDKGYFRLATVHDSKKADFSLPQCQFRARSVLEPGDRIDVLPDPIMDGIFDEDGKEFETDKIFDPRKLDPAKATAADMQKAIQAESILQDRIAGLSRKIELAQACRETTGMIHRFIGMAVLTLDLINTPGLIGLRQRDPHRGLARRLAALPPRRGMAGVSQITRLVGGGTYLGAAVNHLNANVPYDRLIVITDEQSHDPVGSPKGRGYMLNVAAYQNGVGYGPWTRIDGFSENVLRFIREHEADDA